MLVILKSRQSDAQPLRDMTLRRLQFVLRRFAQRVGLPLGLLPKRQRSMAR